MIKNFNKNIKKSWKTQYNFRYSYYNNFEKMGFNLIDFTFKLFKELRKHDITLIYQGVITHDIIRTFTKIIESSLVNKKESNKTLKKVFNIMVESLQNISQHSASVDFSVSEKGCGIILVSETEDAFHVTAGNIVNETSKKEIEKSINTVNKLSKQELKEMFKEKLSTGRISEKGGAGLGFIDMKKKSENKIEYAFKSIDNKEYFYVINNKINKLL